MAAPQHIVEFIQVALPLAAEVEKRFGIHKLIVLAQAALESDYGTSHIAKVANNHFGTTKGSWTGPFYTASTGLKFRIYQDLMQGYLDYGKNIAFNPAYLKLRSDPENLKKVNRFAYAIAHSPYISETNGDNRADYERGLILRAQAIFEAVKGQRIEVKPYRPGNSAPPARDGATQPAPSSGGGSNSILQQVVTGVAVSALTAIALSWVTGDRRAS
jgi:flagellar protein FlgJ